MSNSTPSPVQFGFESLLAEQKAVLPDYSTPSFAPFKFGVPSEEQLQEAEKLLLELGKIDDDEDALVVHHELFEVPLAKDTLLTLAFGVGGADDRKETLMIVRGMAARSFAFLHTQTPPLLAQVDDWIEQGWSILQRHPNPFIRACIVVGLAEAGEMALVRQFVNDPDPHVREEALDALDE